MTEHTAYDHGVPSWVDLTSPDVDASRAFYTTLFGWDAEDQTGEDGSYVYTMFSMSGKSIAGMGPQQPGMEGMPPIWNSYVNVDDADQAVKAAESAGGQVMMPPMEIFDSGRMAVLADPTGAVISVWQAAQHIGAELTNVPNTYSWNELMTRDLDAAKTFYTQVFGWDYDVQDMAMGPYLVIKGERGGAGGLMAMPDEVPDQVPNHWVVYFTVDDAGAMINRITELGGSVTNGPFDIDGVGRMASVMDPAGGSFAIMQPAMPTE